MKPLIIVLLLAASLFTTAQDKKATALLNEVAENTQAFEQIKIEFEYKMRNKAQGINETLEGTLLSKGDKYKIDVAGQQIISDGKTMWTFLESVNEVQINEPGDDEDSFNPRSFLNTWSEKFNAKIIKESGNEVLLELLPKEATAISKVQLKVDKSKKQLLALTMFDGNNTEFIYSIKRFITNQAFQDNEFTFDVTDYPGIEVIDLR